MDTPKEAAHAATDVGLDDEYEKYNSRFWFIVLFQIAAIVLAVCVIFLNWKYFEVSCMR